MRNTKLAARQRSQQRKEEIDKLNETIETLRAEATAIAFKTIRMTAFAGATISLSQRRHLMPQYERLTYWLQDNGYTGTDILWVALPIVLQLAEKGTIRLDKAVAGKWHLESPKSLASWLTVQGLVCPKATQLLTPRPKLLNILNGGAKLQVVE